MHDPDAYSSVPDDFDDRDMVDVELPADPPVRRTYAEILKLASYDDGLCGDCVAGRCHWGSEAYRAEAVRRHDTCGCARHEQSVYARRQCGQYAPRGVFGFIARCRRTRGHKSLQHQDKWREVTWGGDGDG